MHESVILCVRDTERVILTAGKGVFSSLLDISISGPATGSDYSLPLIVLNPGKHG